MKERSVHQDFHHCDAAAFGLGVYSFSAIRVKCCSTSDSAKTLQREKTTCYLRRKAKTNRNFGLSFVTTPISISLGFKSVERTLAKVETAN